MQFEQALYFPRISQIMMLRISEKWKKKEKTLVQRTSVALSSHPQPQCASPISDKHKIDSGARKGSSCGSMVVLLLPEQGPSHLTFIGWSVIDSGQLLMPRSIAPCNWAIREWVKEPPSSLLRHWCHWWKDCTALQLFTKESWKMWCPCVSAWTPFLQH